MIVPPETDIGRHVTYTGGAGEIEQGIITSFNSTAVFVRFGAKVTSEACDRETLSWAWASGSASNSTTDNPTRFDDDNPLGEALNAAVAFSALESIADAFSSDSSSTSSDDFSGGEAGDFGGGGSSSDW